RTAPRATSSPGSAAVARLRPGSGQTPVATSTATMANGVAARANCRTRSARRTIAGSGRRLASRGAEGGELENGAVRVTEEAPAHGDPDATRVVGHGDAVESVGPERADARDRYATHRPHGAVLLHADDRAVAAIHHVEVRVAGERRVA